LGIFGNVALAAPEKESSKISAYAGKYAGTVSYVFGGSPLVSGPAKAVFKASSKNETGRLVLTSSFVLLGESVTLMETVVFKKRSAVYSATIYVPTLGTRSGRGTGKLTIKDKVIKYPITIPGTAGSLVGTIQLGKKGLEISHIANGVAGYSYKFRRSGKK
jgi:hypothetical protein